MTEKKSWLTSLPECEATNLVEKILEACVKFVNGEITFEQLWHRTRGPRRFSAIQRVKDEKLGYFLYALCMDFECWKGTRDDIIRESACAIAKLVRPKNTQ